MAALPVTPAHPRPDPAAVPARTSSPGRREGGWGACGRCLRMPRREAACRRCLHGWPGLPALITRLHCITCDQCVRSRPWPACAHHTTTLRWQVEEMLHSHPAIAEASCFGVPDVKRGEALAVWIKLRWVHLECRPDVGARLCSAARRNVGARPAAAGERRWQRGSSVGQAARQRADAPSCSIPHA